MRAWDGKSQDEERKKGKHASGPPTSPTIQPISQSARLAEVKGKGERGRANVGEWEQRERK